MAKDEKNIEQETDETHKEKTDVRTDENSGQDQADTSDEQENDLASEDEEISTEDLQKALDEAEKKNSELSDRLVRLQADFENFKRRSRQDKESYMKYKSQDLATDILPVLDNFERALQTEVEEEGKDAFKEGVKMVYDQLIQALESQGVEEIEAAGKQFDPNVHQAIMQVDEEGYESNEVVEVLQKGYILKDRVIRPAMVKVNQ